MPCTHAFGVRFPGRPLRLKGDIEVRCERCSFIAEFDDEWCPRCGQWLGIGLEEPIEISLIHNLTFKDMVKLRPYYFMLDEIIHHYTEWHGRYGAVKRYCDWVQRRLENGIRI